MALASRLSLQIMVVILPLFGTASGGPVRCQSIFDPLNNGIPAKIEVLADRAYKASRRAKKSSTKIDEAILNEVAQAMRQRFDALGVRYAKLTNSSFNLGQFSYRIVPDNHTQYGRLARDIEKEHKADLVFSAEHYLGATYRGFVFDKRLSIPDSRPLFLLGLEEIYRSSRALRSPTILHELRHLRVGQNLLLLKDSAFYGKLKAHEDNKLPGFKIYKSSPYSEVLPLDEVRTFHTTLRVNLLRIKKLLREGHRSQVKEEVLDTENFLGKLIEITEASNQAYEALIKIVETRENEVAFDGLGLTMAIFDLVQVENSRFRAEIPVVDADFYGTIPAQKLEALRITLYEKKAVTEALAKELVEVNHILDPVINHGANTSNQALNKLIDMALPHLGMLPH